MYYDYPLDTFIILNITLKKNFFYPRYIFKKLLKIIDHDYFDFLKLTIAIIGFVYF